MSESSIQLRTQATAVDTSVSLDSAGRLVTFHASSQARRQAKYKPRFAEFSYGAWDVSARHSWADEKLLLTGVFS